MCSLEIDPSDEIWSGKIIEWSDLPEKKLDSLFLDEPVTAMKIDVEGFELNVLKWATKILSNHHSELFIECATVTPYKIISSYLDKFNYKMVTTYNNTATRHFSVRYKSKFFSKFFLVLYF